jgi:hypothetical protein
MRFVKTKIFAIWPFTKRACQPLMQEIRAFDMDRGGDRERFLYCWHDPLGKPWLGEWSGRVAWKEDHELAVH